MGRRTVFVVGCSVVVACGARTALREPAPVDASVADAQEEDAAPPPSDAFPDVPVIGDCPDAGSTFVYVLGMHGELYSFYPPSLKFVSIGKVACAPDAGVNSMAVTRTGIAFANFADGNVFEVATANAACKPTPYVPNPNDFTLMGMGFAGNADGGETLYIAEIGSIFAKGLATLDTQSLKVTFIAPIDPQIFNCELTGTASGRLFGFCPFGSGAYFTELDPATAKQMWTKQISAGLGSLGNGTWAFAFWGGVFWLFTGESDAPSKVTRYDPTTSSETVVATAPISIVGAGVSTCAPE